MQDFTTIFETFPMLETERFLLRGWMAGDAPDLLRLMGDPKVTRYLSRPPLADLEEAERRVEYIQSLFATQSGIVWGILPRGEDRLIGQVLVFQLQQEHSRAELGYALIPEWWGKGVSTEVTTRALDFAFDTMNLHSMEAKIDPANQGSRHVLEKQGFVQEGYFHENFFDPMLLQFSDTAVFSLLQRDWKSRSSR